MRIVLINPYIKSGKLFHGFMKKIGSSLPPLGLAYIAAYLEQNNHEVIIIDNRIEQLDLKSLYYKIEKFDPQIIGITSISTQLLYTIITAKFLKKKLQNVKIVVGGPHASSAPIELLDYCKEIDYIIKGEGEIGFLKFIKNLNKGENLKNTPGIAYKNNHGNYINNEPIVIEDIGILPFPARHLLPMKEYRPSLVNYNTLPSRSLITSRGCPYNCSFCSKIYTGKVRFNNEQKILEEISILIDQYKAKELIYWDDCFTFNKNRSIKLFKVLKSNNIDIPWMSMARIDQMSKSFLIEAKKNNCWRLGFGIESGDPQILKKTNKFIDLNQAYKVIKFCKKIGISTRIFLMLGTPYESRDSIQRTIQIAKKLNPEIVQFSYFVPFPMTKDYEYILKNYPTFDSQYYFKDVYPDYHNLDKLVFTPEYISEKDLKKFHALAYFNYYFRFKYIIGRIKNNRTLLDLYKNLSIPFNLLNDFVKKIF